jgi:hypothetical protein
VIMPSRPIRYLWKFQRGQVRSFDSTIDNCQFTLRRIG